MHGGAGREQVLAPGELLGGLHSQQKLFATFMPSKFTSIFSIPPIISFKHLVLTNKKSVYGPPNPSWKLIFLGEVGLLKQSVSV